MSLAPTVALRIGLYPAVRHLRWLAWSSPSYVAIRAKNILLTRNPACYHRSRVDRYRTGRQLPGSGVTGPILSELIGQLSLFMMSEALAGRPHGLLVMH
jgi:hypothetical protein